MGLWQTVKYSRHATKVQGAILFLFEHSAYRCAYCGKEYGSGLGVPVADILNHMLTTHPEKIDKKECEKYIKAFS